MTMLSHVILVSSFFNSLPVPLLVAELTIMDLLLYNIT